MYPQSKCTQAQLCSLFTSLFNTQVLHYSVQLALNSPERIQSWSAVTWIQRVPESVCVAYKLHILFTVKEEQVYVPSGIRDALSMQQHQCTLLTRSDFFVSKLPRRERRLVLLPVLVLHETALASSALSLHPLMTPLHHCSQTLDLHE